MFIKTCFNNQSKHGLKSSILKSGICKYFRRDEQEKFTWCVMEMSLFHELTNGKSLITNLINRLKILIMEDLSFEDIGLVKHLIHILELYDMNRHEYRYLLQFCNDIFMGKRNRMVSYMNSWWKYNTGGEVTLEKHFINESKEYFKNGDTNELLIYGENIIHYFQNKDDRVLGMYNKYLNHCEKQGRRYRRVDPEYLWYEIIESRIDNDLKEIVSFALSMFKRKGLKERHAFSIWLGLILLKMDHLIKNTYNIHLHNFDSDKYFQNMKRIYIDDYVTNDFHVNKAFGLKDYALNGAYVKDEDFSLFENSNKYKEHYIQCKEKMDDDLKTNNKKPKCKHTKGINENDMLYELLDPIFQNIVESFSGKVFTKDQLLDICNICHVQDNNNYIDWSMFKNIRILEEGVCGGKVCCIRVTYMGKEFVLKEMNESMNFGKDYYAIDKCKSYFKLNHMNMKIITSNHGLSKKDKTHYSFVNNCYIEKRDNVIYCMMDYWDNIGDLGKHKEFLKDNSIVKECLKIRLFDGIFRSSDNILRNILVNKNGELLSIDEGDIFGKRKLIFNKKGDWCKKNINMDILNEVIDDIINNFHKHKEDIFKHMEHINIDELITRMDNYKMIVLSEFN
jgi:hypothetical protein